MMFFLVPKPRLGNALAEKPRLLVNKALEAGASSPKAFPSRGLGTRKPIKGGLK